MHHLRIHLGLLLLASTLWAFNPPADKAAGFSATIEGVPESVDLDQPMAFTLVVQNSSGEAARGSIEVDLNDDWSVTPSSADTVFQPGTTRLSFSAVAGPRAVQAHYPVHARCRFGTPAGAVNLHPIAVFTTTRSKASVSEPSRPGITAAPYPCVTSSQPVAIDGELSEWDHAVPVFAGSDMQSTGEITPASFGAVVRMVHDARMLYLSADISDDEISCEDTRTPDFMNSDYIRIYISGDDPAARTDHQLGKSDTVLAVSVFGKDGTTPLPKLVDYGFDTRDNLDLKACRMAAQPTDTGYRFEAALPWQALGIDPAPGRCIGMNILLGDADAGKRKGEICLGCQVPQYWTDPSSYFRLALRAENHVDGPASDLPPLCRLKKRTYRLTELFGAFSGLTLGEEARPFPTTWEGNDPDTGASCRRLKVSRNGEELDAFSMHPPYRNGTAGGRIWRQYYIQLPEITPITFTAMLAIRDHTDREAPSDGVDFRLTCAVADSDPVEKIALFTDSRSWVPVKADLSEYAGKNVLLTLTAGPGPENNTSCDNGFWGNPELTIGERPQPATEEEWLEQTRIAVELARKALAGDRTRGTFILDSGEAKMAAAILPGKRGLHETVIAFTDGNRDLAFRGLTVEIDGLALGDDASDLRPIGAAAGRRFFGHYMVSQNVELMGRTLSLECSFGQRDGALQAAFTMPGVHRDRRGTPRFTRLGLGRADEHLFRVYLGFGNVIQNPNAFSVRAGGFGLSTRHIGADYSNGISLLQAVDIFPDRAVCDPERNLFTLEAHHDITLTLIPGTRGAFAAARQYRDLAGFSPGRGVRNLLGRMCIDQWGGDYGVAAEDLALAAKYGLTHSIFVKHAWQRWGYDYRLPEIYPPSGSMQDFLRMRNACRDNGILFAPHDNYIDFYPDAEGYSYDSIVFNRDGSPQRAWFNKGRKAQSYRWLPHAFLPWLKENMVRMHDGFDPDALFIDVFSAMPPIDYYDREGFFYPKTVTTREWKRAFDTSRKILGHGAPMLSEAGHDALTGSLDGVQSDHYSADRWGAKGDAACRTPWHDMASHGALVLLAGGLGHRYSDGDSSHGYGSDDYLSNTVIGGRNPMCDGPFSRHTVMTYWLLHDVCDALAHADLETHDFTDTVYRQHTTFSDGSEVWTNRGDAPWLVEGKELPRYGFHVRTPEAEAGVYAFGDLRGAFARSNSVLFADARPPSGPVKPPKLACRVLGGEYLGDGKFRVQVEWESFRELEKGLVPFVHICHPEAGSAEHIAHHGQMSLAKDSLVEPTKVLADITAEIPANSYGGTYELRFGLYNPSRGGYRVIPEGDVDASRVRGGLLQVDIANGKITGGKYVQETTDAQGGINGTGIMLDFGAVRTNGAFRLDHPAEGPWLLAPLPGSLPFAAEIDIVKLGKTARQVHVEPVEPRPLYAEPEVTLSDTTLALRMDARCFAYRITFE